MKAARCRRPALGALLACLWLSAHAASLTRFPPMHADEAWLASETRAILTEGSVAAPAEFFHLGARPAHAIRLLFHFLQAPFVAASWSLASVRLLSLACGLAVVGLAGALAGGFRSAGARLLLVAGLALDPQLFASSHLARPEIALAAALLGALVLRGRRPLPGPWTEVLAGSVLGLAVGIHANSLLVALAVGALYALDVLAGPRRGRALLRLAVLVGVTAFWAALWVLWSRLLSPEFPRQYAEFGQRYGVGESLAVKLLRLPGFYARLFGRIAGTYYVPDLRLPLLLFAAAAAASLVLLAARAARRATRSQPRARAFPAVRLLEPLALLLGLNAGLAAIGKYSQPSAVLLVPGGWWLASAVLEALAGGGGREPPASSPAGGTAGRSPAGTAGPPLTGPPLSGRRDPRAAVALAAAAVLVAGLGLSTALQAEPWMGVRYGRYLQRIRAQVPAGAPVLGGPNTAFALAPGALHAFNDLEALRSAGLGLAQYVERYGIRWILYPSELDRIYAERPLWNDLYGNPVPWYAELRRFLAERCRKVAEYEEPVFAMRIVAYQADHPAARLTIYCVLPSAGPTPSVAPAPSAEPVPSAAPAPSAPSAGP